ncbi:hypothetical protein BaRGS_00017193 [Batillaria attramentaria]|uniref:Uncharacterized protein n=1 Tax=Batillaria attramentaria TaxID=370345 RepID=A0ABD0KWP5_9CAEN
MTSAESGRKPDEDTDAGNKINLPSRQVETPPSSTYSVSLSEDVTMLVIGAMEETLSSERADGEPVGTRAVKLSAIAPLRRYQYFTCQKRNKQATAPRHCRRSGTSRLARNSAGPRLSVEDEDEGEQRGLEVPCLVIDLNYIQRTRSLL